MKNPLRVCLGVLAVALLCACGSVTSNIAFHPPSGWTASPSFLGRVQMWVKEGTQKRRSQTVILMRGALDTGDLFQAGNFGQRRVTAVKRTTVMICSGRQAQYITATGENGKNGRTSRIEAIVADVGDATYMAMYVRDAHAAPDRQAETAIHSVCPKD